MLSSFFRILSASLLGLAGVGAASPIVYVSVSAPHFQNVWKSRIGSFAPALECTQSGYGGGGYQVFLTLIDDKKVSSELQIGFKVKIVRVEEVRGNDDDNIARWRLRIDGDGTIVVQKLKYGFTVIGWEGRNDAGYDDLKCDVQNIIFKRSESTVTQPKILGLNKLKLKINEDQCGKGFGYAECNISFDSEDNLEWSEKFKPTVVYSAF